MMFREGEVGQLKGPGFLAFSKGMPVMLLQNTKTSSGLVNGMTATAERAILDTDIQRMYQPPFANYMLTIRSYVDRARRPIRLMHLSASLPPRTPYS